MIKNIDYLARHQRLFGLLGDHACVLLSQPVSHRNSDVDFPYRQESFLYYLTGLDEPMTALVVAPDDKGIMRRTLFLRERDPAREIWDGEMLGVDRAKGAMPIDDARPIARLWQDLPQLLQFSEAVYFPFGLDAEADRAFVPVLTAAARLRKKERTYRLAVLDPVYLAGLMRSKKQPEEIARLDKAAEITQQAYQTMFTTPLVGKSERFVHGLLLQGFAQAGAEMEAYPSIVAAGKNACTLHYIRNQAPLIDGEMLLVDAGAQFDYYACDVTRTFPLGKTFSPEQRVVYEIVLAAQQRGIEFAIAGHNLEDLHQHTIRWLMEGMHSAGLLRQSVDETIETQSYKKYYPHGTSHWLGMDVHDVGEYRLAGKPLALENGMCFTIEPGLYFQPDLSDVPERFRGLGVRIEDDILIADGQARVLTAKIPKKVDELENRW